MKFLVCFDGSNTSKAAIDLAINHASAFRASLIIVNSMVKGTESEREQIQNMESLLSDIQKGCETKDISCETHLLIRGLDAGEDLVAFANEQQVDQVFIGVRRRSKMEKLVFGSTAQYVILNANCPVVTIR